MVEQSETFRALVKGADTSVIEQRLRQYAPNLDLMTGEQKAKPDAVILSWDDYLSMLDQIEIADAYTKTRDEESFPDDVAKRLIARENPIRVFREYRALTIRKLADMAGISAGYLSDLENGKRIGPTDTMKALATALTVDLDMLV